MFRWAQKQVTNGIFKSAQLNNVSSMPSRLLLPIVILLLLNVAPVAALDFTVTPYNEEQDSIFKSADGTYLAFDTDSALVQIDTNNTTDVYVLNLKTNMVTIASLYDGQPIQASSQLTRNDYDIKFANKPISDDGRYVYFFVVDGSSTYLARRDIVNNVTVEVSTGYGLKNGYNVSLSADGRYALYAFSESFGNISWALRDMTANTSTVVAVGVVEIEFKLTDDGSKILYRLRNDGNAAPFGFIDRINFNQYYIETTLPITPTTMQMVATVDGGLNNLNDPGLIYYDQFYLNKTSTRLIANFSYSYLNDYYNWLQYVNLLTGETNIVTPRSFGSSTTADITGQEVFGINPFCMSDDGKYLVFTYGMALQRFKWVEHIAC